MAKMEIHAILEYDASVMHGDFDDEEAYEWFRDLMMTEDLILHSNEIGDEVGIVHIFYSKNVDE